MTDFAPLSRGPVGVQMRRVGHAIYEVVEQFMRLVPFNQVLQIRIESLEDGFVRMAIPFREELIGDPFRRALHGGVISALVDTAGGAALMTRCEVGDRLSTVDMRVDYLRPGLPEDVIVDATVVRLGNRVGVAEMRAYHAGRKAEPIASGKAVYNIRRADSG
ncbi:MAG: hotdog fold thioesterase [Deltaproteobacteria bacterium]|jgi:uncharacterized protein (TIGR00369 family)